MRAFVALGLVVLVSTCGRRASAEEGAPRPRKVELGLSSGFSSLGLGNSGQLSGFDTLWAIPLLLDLDYRLSKHWSIGAYGELGFIDNRAPDLEDAEATVKGHHYRLGVEALYHAAPGRRVQSWLGVGVGFDAIRATHFIRSTFPPFQGAPADPGTSSALRANGFELGHAQLGIDFVLVPALAFGPFVGASVVSYGGRRGLPNQDDFSVWANIGLKATVRL